MKASLVFLVVLLLGGVADAAIVYTAPLDGVSEDSPNESPGTGSATVTYDFAAHTLRVDVNFADLMGTTTASHIHAPTPAPLTGPAGVATQTPSFSGFPLGVTSGSYDHTFDLTDPASFNAPYLTDNGGTAAGAEAALATALAEGKAYLNIHTTSFSAGEIRGFLVAVPEPASVTMVGAALVGCLALRRRHCTRERG
ncbi:MAG TPA: CHRD domain-containing protein [bacterium]|jgi:hypothetical protein